MLGDLAAGEATGDIVANCPAGKKVLGGGVIQGGVFVVTNKSYPSPTGGPNPYTGWTVSMINVGTVDLQTHFATVYAICADVTP